MSITPPPLPCALDALGSRPMRAGRLPREFATPHLKRHDGPRGSAALDLRAGTPIETVYFAVDGLLPYVSERVLAQS
jgi:hypothetical protein